MSNKIKKQFAVVVGNPPYQFATKGGNGQRDLWPEFVKLSFKLCKENEFITLVHPSKWRRPEHKLWNEMKKNDILYLEIHSDQDGYKTFKAATRYDWYLLRKSNNNIKTLIKDEKNELYELDIKKVPFISNFYIKEIYNIDMFGNGKNNLKVIYDSGSYYNQNKNISAEKDDIFRYECVHSITKNGVKYLYSSDNYNLFGVPKVIVNMARHPYPKNDFKGEFGMTNNTFGIQVETNEEAENIIRALNSNMFKNIIKATKWGNFQVDYHMFKLFRKDFWKEFI